MSKRIGFFVALILFLIIALFSVPLMFAQAIPWDYCKLDAYGTNVIEDVVGEIEYTQFTVAEPPASSINNTVYVINYDTGENYTQSLEIGDMIGFQYQGINPISYIVEEVLPGEYRVYYEGEVARFAINQTQIPEFSTVVIIPMFIVATAIAIVYRRKRTSQNQTTD